MTLVNDLIVTLFDAQWSNFQDNYDPYRFGPKRGKPSRRTGILVDTMLRRVGLIRKSSLNQINQLALSEWAPLWEDLEWLYGKLADPDSRQILVQVLAFRLMGPRAIRLPLSTPSYWNRLRALDQLAKKNDQHQIAFQDWKLYLHDLNAIGFPIRLYIRSPGVMSQFVLQQYCPPGIGIALQPGSVVIDGGGCWGDSALYFATKTGNTGRVYSFEFVPSNLTIYEKNLRLNENISTNVEVIEHALWSVSGEQLAVDVQGPGSSVRPKSTAGGTCQANTITIDNFCEMREIERLDLIKMDIEGAEFEALKGAKQTIAKFRPHLALCIYHSPPDFVRLARLIDEMNLDYTFKLRHFTIHAEETVLYAIAGGQ